MTPTIEQCIGTTEQEGEIEPPERARLDAELRDLRRKAAERDELLRAVVALDEIIDRGTGMPRNMAGLFSHLCEALEWTRGVNAPAWLREIVLAAARERVR